MPEETPVIAVVGPTATGKSDLAIGIAQALGGEVINADALQFYRGMDVGTAKLPGAARRGVPHHLLDVLDVTEEASVATYQLRARTVIAELADRDRVAVLVGGSGLYVRAVLDDLQIPPTDPVARARREEQLVEVGPDRLHALLHELDPTAAERILPGNSRRVVRALEVIDLTGRPFSATMPERRYVRPAVQLGLTAPREVLDERIAARVDRMFAGGLLEETSRLLELGLRRGRTASRALGYLQAVNVLDGVWSLEQARDDLIRATKRYARRQESWFRADPRVRWVPYDAPDLAAVALRTLER
jgi:tRNA dimethylallyltransferase